MTTANVTADVNVLVYQIWLRHNLVMSKTAEIWRFICFQNGGWPPSWIFAEVKFEGISVSGTFLSLNQISSECVQL